MQTCTNCNKSFKSLRIHKQKSVCGIKKIIRLNEPVTYICKQSVINNQPKKKKNLKKKLYDQIKSDFPQLNIKWIGSSIKSLQEIIQQQKDNQINDQFKDFKIGKLKKMNGFTVLTEQTIKQIKKDLILTFQTQPSFDIILCYIYQNNEIEKKVFRLKSKSQIEYFENCIQGENVNIGSESQYNDLLQDCVKFLYKIQPINSIITENHQKIKRSQHGQGNDLMNCQEFENQHIYIPNSGNCLQNIVIHYINQLNLSNEMKNDYQNHVIEQFSKYCKDNQIYRQNIRYCDLNRLFEQLNFKNYTIKCTYLRKKEIQTNMQQIQIKLQPRESKYDILVYIQDDHYIQIKSNNYKQALIDINQNLKWTQKTINDVHFDDVCEVKQSIDKLMISLQEQYENVYVFDLETYCDQENLSQVYSCGFMSVQDYHIMQGQENDQIRQICQITYDSNCIYEMLQKINSQYKPLIKINKIKVNGKIVNQKIKSKNEIILIAHNSAKFDSYIVLQQSNIKFDHIIEKNGVISLSINDEQFQNCKFKLIDSYRFLSTSLKNLCNSFQVHQDFSKTSLEHYDINKENFMQKIDLWKPYLENDVLSLCDIWYKFTQKLYQATQKNHLSLDLRRFITISSYSKKLLNSLLSDQIYYTKDPVLRQFIQENLRGGRVQCLISKFQSKCIKNYDITQYDYLSEEIVDQIIQNQDYLIPFDATSLYPSAMYLEKPYPKIQTARKYVLQQDSLENLIKNNQQFMIRCDLYIPEDLKFVPISYKTKSGQAQFRVAYIQNQVINDVDYEELLKFDIKITKIYEGVVFQESVIAPYREFVKQMFNQRKLVKNTDSILGDMYKLLMNSSYGKLCQKEIKSYQGLTTEKTFFDQIYDDQITEAIKLQNNQICYKQEKYQDQIFSENHMACYVLSYSKQIMNQFVLKMNAHKESKIYYMDTDSMYISIQDYKKYLQHVQDDLCGGKNDYGENQAIIYADFIGCKQKVCYSVSLNGADKGKIKKHITFKGIQTSEFKNLTDDVIQKILQGEDQFMKNYVWNRSKQYGVQIQDENHQNQNGNYQKSVNNHSQMQKYDYNPETNIFDYKICEKDKDWSYYYNQ